MPGILLDRDGVLLEDRVDYVKNIGEVQLFPRAIEAVRLLWQYDYEICVVTNQSGVGKGIYSAETVAAIHAFMETQFQQCSNGKIHWYFCPHRDEDGCTCRKPKPGMLQEALRTHGYNAEETWMVGDALRDIEAGQSAGCRTALVRTGRGNSQPCDGRVVPERIYDDLLQFVEESIVGSSSTFP